MQGRVPKPHENRNSYGKLNTKHFIQARSTNAVSIIITCCCFISWNEKAADKINSISNGTKMSSIKTESWQGFSGSGLRLKNVGFHLGLIILYSCSIFTF